MSNRRIQTQVQRQATDKKMTCCCHLFMYCLFVCMYMFLSEVTEVQYIYQVRQEGW